MKPTYGLSKKRFVPGLLLLEKDLEIFYGFTPEEVRRFVKARKDQVQQ